MLHGFLIITPKGVRAANGSFDIKGRMPETFRVAWGQGLVGSAWPETHCINMNDYSFVISTYRFKRRARKCPFFSLKLKHFQMSPKENNLISPVDTQVFKFKFQVFNESSPLRVKDIQRT